MAQITSQSPSSVANQVARVSDTFLSQGTLLNLLFDTKFEILDSTKGRGQTTKGIWMATNPQNRILVLDIEGTDSKERGEQKMVSDMC